MKNKGILYIPLLALLATVCQAEVYRWTDEQGNVVFGDNPPVSKKAQPLEEKKLQETGGRFATDNQLDRLRKGLGEENSEKPNSAAKNSYCRNNVKQLNKTEAFLKHTYTKLDAQKAADLRKLISKECGSGYLEKKFNDHYCEDYRQQLSKIEIYLTHTPNDRDKQKAQDLREQIRRECR